VGVDLAPKQDLGTKYGKLRYKRNSSDSTLLMPRIVLHSIYEGRSESNLRLIKKNTPS